MQGIHLFLLNKNNWTLLKINRRMIALSKGNMAFLVSVFIIAQTFFRCPLLPVEGAALKSFR